MTRTELLSLAERLDAHALLHEQQFPQDEEQRAWAADLRAQAAMNRKLAELRQVATSYTMEALVPGGTVKTHVTLHHSLPAGTALYQLSEVLTDV